MGGNPSRKCSGSCHSAQFGGAKPPSRIKFEAVPEGIASSEPFHERSEPESYRSARGRNRLSLLSCSLFAESTSGPVCRSRIAGHVRRSEPQDPYQRKDGSLGPRQPG